MSLPPIDANFSWARKEAVNPAMNAALDAELQALHDSLGVKRGEALKGIGTKPDLVVPTPDLQMAVASTLSLHDTQSATQKE